MIYLDYQATTPVDPVVLDAMLPWLRDQFANPHSAHRPGREAAAAVAHARDQVAALLPAGGRLIFTSGATEAINMAMRGLGLGPGSTIAITAIEHAAVRDTAAFLAQAGVRVIDLPVTPAGLIDVDAAAAHLPDRLDLLCVMHVNNEIGTIQPVDALADIVHARGGLLLCDAVQGCGKLPAPQRADMIIVSAHKIYGPKGIGALWLRGGVEVMPLIHGGGQEQGLRGGTLSPALCIGLGAAAAQSMARMDADRTHCATLAARLRARLGPQWQLNGVADARWPGNLNLWRDGLDAARLMSDCRDIAFSLGSACGSGSGRPSHVLAALGLDKARLRASIRIGIGRMTTAEEVDAAADRLVLAAQAQQQVIGIA